MQLSHKVSVTSSIVLKWTLLFAVFFWVIDDHPFSLLRCVEDILDYRLFILLAELHHTSCVTVMQGFFNVFLLFPS